MQEGGQLLLPFPFTRGETLLSCGETLLSAASSEHGRWHMVAHRCSHGGTNLRGNPAPQLPQ